MNIKNGEIEPGKEGKIEFEWIGEFQKENLERSMTFVAGGSTETRFTVPIFVEGTDPTPKKVAKRKITPSEKRIESPRTSKKSSVKTERSGD